MQEPTYDPRDCLLIQAGRHPEQDYRQPAHRISTQRINSPHRHGGANVGAYVLKGTLLNKMNEEPMKTIEEGGSWFEAPGCHHRISDNASKTEPATLIATMLTDTEVFERDGMGALIQIDEEYR
ncbi:Cupin 2 conserved barrel [Penicillium mononematosum]|uniref:Cupin 2 conserved barrel n=1 Tax=Penicillium mononematosum TaxID=268346 RepID=UPI00254903A8|nr:Cupin 2 conserved barrel [Penicillium mononematosum]KAJ6188035.1 Cupin 2 conserved barrel [Penicillium mononematosum]